MKLPLKVKAILMIVIIALLIGVTAIIVYSKGITDLTTKEYESRSLDTTKAMAQILNADQVKTLRDNVLKIYDAEDKVVLSDQWGTPEFNVYISDYSEIENTKEFISLRKQLRQVQDVIDVDCLYITWYDSVNERYIYLVDAAYDDACPPGCANPLYSENLPENINLLESCPPNITHTKEYGYLMTTAMPIRTKDGEVVGFASVDLSMNDLVRNKQNLLLMSVFVFGVVTVIASLVGIYIVDRTIVRPINTLSETAKSYTANDLKVINDQYGHDKGNVAIKSLAGIICDVFKHSPVFRFGGDEFVVILTKRDLDNRESLIGRFRDEIRRSSTNTNLQPWERLSAACGCAVYNPNLDSNATSVFKRADEDMYEHKVAMKKAASSMRPVR